MEISRINYRFNKDNQVGFISNINNSIRMIGNILTIENVLVLRHVYYMVHTGFIGIYFTVHIFAQ